MLDRLFNLKLILEMEMFSLSIFSPINPFKTGEGKTYLADKKYIFLIGKQDLPLPSLNRVNPTLPFVEARAALVSVLDEKKIIQTDQQVGDQMDFHLDVL